MKIKKIMLFCYDFEHKKTQDLILNLIANNYNIDFVIAAPYKKLKIPKSSIGYSPINEGIIHPKKLCNMLNIKYYTYPHNSSNTIKIIKNNPVDLYIIAGARILSKDIIEATDNKIINIHPGLLPQMRGLDTLLWSINEDIPIGITTHFINEKIDKGSIIYKEKIEIRQNDTIQDISLRLLEKQPSVLIKSLNKLNTLKVETLNENKSFKNSKYHSKMNPKEEEIAFKKFEKWKSNNLY